MPLLIFFYLFFLVITDVDTGQINLPRNSLRHLRWLLQKDRLGQDAFLLGRPGPARRAVAMQYLQLTQREVEYVALSRDTTEADLKQRREIVNGSAKYFDQVRLISLILIKYTL